MESKIKSFTDLNAWKEGHKLVLSVYKQILNFPKTEQFGLADQMRRCAVSITSNIAEGFSRRTSKDKIQFYYIALGSVTELQNQLIIARDLKYISIDSFKELADQTIIVSKLINGLIKSLSSHNT
jgi:four helix bundle protein